MTLQPGKLPADLLKQLLVGLHVDDRRVLLGPGLGRDAAVLDLGDRVLVATSDPITFATEHLGWYAVNVNANDIACMGAKPRWFLATALLPEGSDESLARRLFEDLQAACAALGVTLVGGHTEVTQAVERPVVCGTMLGDAARDDVIDGSGVKDGDVVLLTQAIAIEGTALLARECGEALASAGVDQHVIESSRERLFTPGISVVRDATALRAVCRPRALHDPTEGGVASALYELAEATGRTVRIYPEEIAVLAETNVICAALGLDPLGLLASGALLAIVDQDDAPAACAALQASGIPCNPIGRIEEGSAGVIMGAGHSTAPFPTFARDELARYFAGRERAGGA